MMNPLQIWRQTQQRISKMGSTGIFMTLMLLLPVAAHAFTPVGPTQSIPEPDTLALLGIGAAAWAAGKWLRR